MLVYMKTIETATARTNEPKKIIQNGSHRIEDQLIFKNMRAKKKQQRCECKRTIY